MTSQKVPPKTKRRYFRSTVFWILGIGMLTTYFALLSWAGPLRIGIISLPIPTLSTNTTAKDLVGAGQSYGLHQVALAEVESQRQELIARRRQRQINKVESFFKVYRGGAVLSGYGDIIVDQAEKCGGDYRVLVGIAGSESGLGASMYKKYNPYGYLDGVQYKNLKEAMTILSCKVSEEHISVCKTDLNCLANRYAGSQDDKQHFINKVKWFMDQVT